MPKKILANNQIRASEVRVIDENGKQIGIMPLKEALKISQKRNLDLIQVTENVTPPVCKLGILGKYLYQLAKKEKTKGKKTAGKIKGIRLTFSISKHDLEIKAEQAKKFLEKGEKIRIEMQLHGREKALQKIAEEKINTFLTILKEKIPIKIEQGLKKQPRGLTMILIREK